jgi:hypothetical protein
VKTQTSTEPATEARARAVAKVTRPAAPWREVYQVGGVGVAVHNAARENA